MKFNDKIKYVGLQCLFPLVLLGCTDWNDHYSDEQNVVASNTLWEEIEARPELNEFKNYLEQYGYKEILNSSQMYTVFAPVGPIDTMGIGLSGEKIKKELIENHISRFAHSANSAMNVNPEIVMLNTKVINFTKTAEGYVFGDSKVTEDYNIRAKNGVLHVIEGQQMFFHNIWEYLATDSRFDNIRNYLYSFNDTILDEDKSVKGEINENGKQVYLDSVVYINNSMLYTLGQLNNEDSIYTMIVPTNRAWDSAYARIKEYYKYPTNIERQKRDSMQHYYTQLGIVRDLVFSHNRQESIEDSLISTVGGVFEKPFEYILSGYSDWNQSLACSNGGIFVMDSLRYNPWDSWHEPIKIEAERANALATDATSGAQVFRRTLPNTDTLYAKVSGGAYVEFVPETSISKPVITFNIWNTLAGKYDVKVVLLPQAMASSNKGALKRSNMFNLHSYSLSRSGELTAGSRKRKITNDALRVDTVDAGTVNLNYCAFGTERISLQLKLESVAEDEGVKYSTTYLIDCIILEPHNPSKK